MFTHTIAAPGILLPDLPPVGRCVYGCLTTPEVKLTREHVIPDGIGGNLVLPDASCGACRDITNWFEQDVQKTYFGATRDLKGIKSSKRRGRNAPSRQNYIISEDVGWMPRKNHPEGPGKPPRSEMQVNDFMREFVIVEDYGNSLPGILRGGSVDENLGLRLGVRTATTQPMKKFLLSAQIQPARFQKLLAKIAHTYAVACLGIDGFRPFLLDFIRSKDGKSDYYHIGQAAGDTTSDLHRIGLTLIQAPYQNAIMTSPAMRPLYMAEVQLFAYLDTPIYQVVVGSPR